MVLVPKTDQKRHIPHIQDTEKFTRSFVTMGNKEASVVDQVSCLAGHESLGSCDRQRHPDLLELQPNVEVEEIETIQKFPRLLVGRWVVRDTRRWKLMCVVGSLILSLIVS